MLELDECNRKLVTNTSADDLLVASSGDNHDASVALALENHPLRSRSVTPAGRCNMPNIPSVNVIGSEGETRPRLTRLLGPDSLPAEVAAREGQTTDSEAPRSGSDTVVHLVGPNDTLASVALRHGISIAALRRANRLWPSDPVHLRTELLIPRGDTLPTRPRPAPSVSTDTTLESAAEAAAPSLPPDPFASSFVAARNMIISMLPARMSLESLSSKTSTSEDHELDDFLNAPRTQGMQGENGTTPFSGEEEGHELATLAAPHHPQYKQLGYLFSSQAPCLPVNNHLADVHMRPVGDLHSGCTSSSSTTSLRQPSRAQPFAVLPVRTSQLEPEPAMELPVRRPRIQRSSFLDWMVHDTES